jgi:thiamine-monophosphate kinase
MPSEFQLIARYFTRPARRAVLGVGDDAALFRVGKEMELAVSTDMLVSGTHFVADADPRRLGHKTLAVNLSDMAAMGARPRWALLALALPEAEPAWLRAFAAGFLALADAHDVELVGGDTTRGPLNLCVTIFGEVPRGRALRRDRARVGDDVWVSGELGNAALALANQQGRVRLPAAVAARCLRSLDLPQPRVALGLGLRGLANAAIDISDGLAADLGHICERSCLGADVWLGQIPCSKALAKLVDRSVAEQALVAGGDDYELCFTAAVKRRAQIEALGARIGLPVHRIGAMRKGRGVRLLDPDGRVYDHQIRGFDHFG